MDGYDSKLWPYLFMMKIICKLALLKLQRKLPLTNGVVVGSVYWLPVLFMIIRGNVAKQAL